MNANVFSDHQRDNGHRDHRKGRAIRDLGRLRKKYGPGRWRKFKGRATVQLEGGSTRYAEIHWYEAHGIGRKRFKIKHFLD